MTRQEFIKAVAEVQNALRVGKDRKNDFGGFVYRNASDILEAVKPLLVPHGFMLYMRDEIHEVAGRYYVRAVAGITDGEHSFEASAEAREPDHRQKMDDAQVTGSSSSYARKYALCGLLSIDDSRNDPDTLDNSKNGVEEKPGRARRASVKAEQPAKPAPTAPAQPAAPAGSIFEQDTAYQERISLACADIRAVRSRKTFEDVQREYWDVRNDSRVRAVLEEVSKKYPKQ